MDQLVLSIVTAGSSVSGSFGSPTTSVSFGTPLVFGALPPPQPARETKAAPIRAPSTTFFIACLI